MSCERIDDIFIKTAKTILKDTDKKHIGICEAIEARFPNIQMHTKELIINACIEVILERRKKNGKDIRYIEK